MYKLICNFDGWVLTEWLSYWPPLLVQNVSPGFRDPGLKTMYILMKQFAYIWHLPCWQWKEMYSHVFPLFNKIYETIFIRSLKSLYFWLGTPMFAEVCIFNWHIWREFYNVTDILVCWLIINRNSRRPKLNNRVNQNGGEFYGPGCSATSIYLER